jgi:light-regulated signal transduction histidine kinase (bacteriophytochrome)
MGDVMDALLALSRVSRSPLLIGDVDLSGLARLVADRLRATDPGRAVEFEIEDGLVARADGSLCEVLLQNLLGNAWKFSAGESPARISFGRADVDGRSVYRVSDNGVGFEQKYAGCLFRAFERLHAPGEFPGTGIGLATVGRIVSRFGGECWAEGEVGRGASIFFTLPAGV